MFEEPVDQAVFTMNKGQRVPVPIIHVFPKGRKLAELLRIVNLIQWRDFHSRDHINFSKIVKKKVLDF